MSLNSGGGVKIIAGYAAPVSYQEKYMMKIQGDIQGANNSAAIKVGSSNHPSSQIGILIRFFCRFIMMRNIITITTKREKLQFGVTTTTTNRTFN